MDVIIGLFETNLVTVKTFVEVLFNRQSDEVTALRGEVSELCRSSEFCQAVQAETRELLLAQTEVYSRNCGLQERVRSLEDFSRTKIIRNENSEQTMYAVQKSITVKLKNRMCVLRKLSV